jgi:hypothetical protein
VCTKIYREDCKSEVQISMSEMPTVKFEFRSLKYEDISRPMYGDHDPQDLIIIQVLRKLPSVHINTMSLLLLVFCTVTSCYTFRYTVTYHYLIPLNQLT